MLKKQNYPQKNYNIIKSSPRATGFKNLMIPEKDEEYERHISGPEA